MKRGHHDALVDSCRSKPKEKGSGVFVGRLVRLGRELSKRFAFAGARAYVGALFPVIEAEAQEVCISVFRTHLGTALPSAIWKSQNAVYGSQGRRPYAMVGLPFCSIPLNTVDSYKYVLREHRKAIAEYSRKAEESTFTEIKENSLRYKQFLIDDYKTLIGTAPKTIDN
ncbi:MAG: hypothetical protein ACRD5H_11465 [Nitrososphaerales archaeon]